MLHRTIVANQSVGGSGNPCHKITIQLLRALHGEDPRQRDGNLRKGRFFLFNLAEVPCGSKGP
jgi:hypothetical protein